jgi:hypothetical protein
MNRLSPRCLAQSSIYVERNLSVAIIYSFCSLEASVRNNEHNAIKQDGVCAVAQLYSSAVRKAPVGSHCTEPNSQVLPKVGPFLG